MFMLIQIFFACAHLCFVYIIGFGCLSEETNALNKPLKPNEQPTSAPASVETLEEPKEGCNLSHQIDTTITPRYRLLVYVILFE